MPTGYEAAAQDRTSDRALPSTLRPGSPLADTCCLFRARYNTSENHARIVRANLRQAPRSSVVLLSHGAGSLLQTCWIVRPDPVHDPVHGHLSFLATGSSTPPKYACSSRRGPGTS